MLWAGAAGAGEQQDRELYPPGFEVAVEQGLLFLQAQQKPGGSFEAAGPPAAMAGLAVLAFLANGHTPDVGRYGLTVRNALDYLLNLNPDSGYWGRDGGRMYGHCIVTLALSQAYGTETDPAQRARIKKALGAASRVIIAAQSVGKDDAHIGGWRYEPGSTDSDMSVTAWCVHALAGCRNAGMDIPQERFESAATFIMRCWREKQRGFAYLPTDEPSPGMTGAALACLRMAGASRSFDAAAAGRLVLERPVRDDARYQYSSLYWTTLAAHFVGQPLWPAVWKGNRDYLLSRQRRDDGSWPASRNEVDGQGKAGRFFPTAMAVLTLSVPSQILPVYRK